MLVKEDLEDIFQAKNKEDILSSINSSVDAASDPNDIVAIIENVFQDLNLEWHDLFFELMWHLKRELGFTHSNRILKKFIKEYLKEEIEKKPLNESILDSYETFFNIEFSGLGINEVFEIGGNRYIIDDINLGSRENVIEFTIKGIDTVEKLKLYIDSNTNQAFDIQKIIIPNG